MSSIQPAVPIVKDCQAYICGSDHDAVVMSPKRHKVLVRDNDASHDVILSSATVALPQQGLVQKLDNALTNYSHGLSERTPFIEASTCPIIETSVHEHSAHSTLQCVKKMNEFQCAGRETSDSSSVIALLPLCDQVQRDYYYGTDDLVENQLKEVSVLAQLVDKALVDRHGLSPPINTLQDQSRRRIRYQRRNSFVVHPKRNDATMGLLPVFPVLSMNGLDGVIGNKNRKRDNENRWDAVDTPPSKAARAG